MSESRLVLVKVEEFCFLLTSLNSYGVTHIYEIAKKISTTTIMSHAQTVLQLSTANEFHMVVLSSSMTKLCWS